MKISATSDSYAGLPNVSASRRNAAGKIGQLGVWSGVRPFCQYTAQTMYTAVLSGTRQFHRCSTTCSIIIQQPYVLAMILVNFAGSGGLWWSWCGPLGVTPFASHNCLRRGGVIALNRPKNQVCLKTRPLLRRLRHRHLSNLCRHTWWST